MKNEGYHMGEERGATLVEAAPVACLLLSDCAGTRGSGPRPGGYERRYLCLSELAVGRSTDEGAVLIEFALVIGLFFLLVFGMVDFGLAINTKTQMTNAGREGARLGTVNLDPGAVEAKAAKSPATSTRLYSS